MLAPLKSLRYPLRIRVRGRVRQRVSWPNGAAHAGDTSYVTGVDTGRENISKYAVHRINFMTSHCDRHFLGAEFVETTRPITNSKRLTLLS
jgi:hypothetical protein